MLSKREMEILSLCAVGYSAKEISNRLFISPETARKTLSNVKEKVGINKAAELATFFTCRKLGIDFNEFKKQIIASCLLVLISIGEFNMVTQKPMIRVRNRVRTEQRSYKREISITTI